jgi:hypothetical protein
MSEPAAHDARKGMGKDKHKQMMVSVVQQARHHCISLLSLQLYEAFSISPDSFPIIHPSLAPYRLRNFTSFSSHATPH